MNGLFGAHYLLWDTLFSLDTVGSVLVLLQLGMPDFADSSREVFLVQVDGVGIGEVREWEKGNWN